MSPHQDAQALHRRVQVRQPHQRLRMLGRVEVEARDRRVGERLLGQLVVVEIVHQTNPILLFLRAGRGGSGGSVPAAGRAGTPVEVGAFLPADAVRAAPLAAMAGAPLFAGAGLDRPDLAAGAWLERFPPRLVMRAATSRKPGSSRTTNSYCSSASSFWPSDSSAAPSSNVSANRASPERSGNASPRRKRSMASAGRLRSISHVPSMLMQSAALVPPPCFSASSNSAMASSIRPISL